jgi:hypothetical protein
MYASALRIPQIPVALIPLIDTLLETVRTEPPHRHSPEELSAMCHGVARAAAEFGVDHAITRRLLLMAAVEHARAEVLPETRTDAGPSWPGPGLLP